MNLLPHYEARSFFGHQDNSNITKWTAESFRIDKKIEWSKLKKNDNIKASIQPINYYCKDNGAGELNLSLKKITNSYNVNILPSNFRMDSPINLMHDNWFVNLSAKTIP